MSYDLKASAAKCDHIMVDERLSISREDFCTLYSVESSPERLRGPVVGPISLKVEGVSIPQDHPEWGWDVFIDERKAYPDRGHKVVLRKPHRNQGVLIEVTYTTSQAHCRKCGGKGFVYDFSINNQGNFTSVEGTKKLSQRVLKYLLTSKCFFYPALTSRLKTYIGRKSSVVQQDAAEEVARVLSNLKQIQVQQAKVQNLSKEEVLSRVDSVVVQPSPSDASVLLCQVKFSNAAAVSSSTTFGVKTRN